MYNPKQFQTNETSVLHDFIRAHPLGLLISTDGRSTEADLIPFYLDAGQEVLRAHVSKANPQWSRLTEHPHALVVFQGPQGYITPNWYATKKVDGKVVPTWNYSMVQVRGPVRVVHDQDWLHRHVSQLTDFFEQSQSTPWALSDAPASFVHGQLKGIVGLEVTLKSLEGKWKMSQNRAAEDRAGVVEGLRVAGRQDLASLIP
ncbi:MAG: FMN-binding negative transcriptional regulator [Candidatus Eremiobacteraeota bacterium]|nr:FMN-binding negative transcriptional regulator [Candidatus Eremiobacteraeota bacterium]MCW5872982.1 FMN-binding negative transcriptional regulator [Candidatus Eremiobacteraeota bacterium]